MFGSKNKRDIYSEDDLTFEKKLDNRQMKKLDKFYIIFACFLCLGWAIWNFGIIDKIKFPKVSLNFISDFLASRAAMKNDDFVFSEERLAATSGDYIVYYQYETGLLNVMKQDGSENRTITEVPMNGFAVKDDWIYYMSPQQAIMKVRFDGSEKTEIIKGESGYGFRIVGNYIYYFSNTLNRVSLDGKEKISINTQRNDEVYPYGNFIYELNRGTNTMYKTRVGSSERAEVFKFEDEQVYRFNIYKGRFYYLAGNQELHTLRLDGTEQIKIDSGVSHYSIEGDKLYYTKFEQIAVQTPNSTTESIKSKLYQCALNGDNVQELLSDSSYSIYLGNNMLYIIQPSTARYAFKDLVSGKTIEIPELEYKTNISNLHVSSGSIPSVKIKGSDYYSNLIKINKDIYYNNSRDSGIYKYNKDSGISPIIKEPTVKFDIIGNLIFFQSQDRLLYCANIDGSNIQKIFDLRVNTFSLREDGLYFANIYGRLCKLQFSDNKIIKLSEDRIDNFTIEGNFMYSSQGGSNRLLKMSLDGSSKEELTLASSAMKFDIVGDYVYYFSETSVDNIFKSFIYRQKLGTNTQEVVVENSTYDYTIGNKYILYTEYLYKTPTTARMMLSTLDGKNKRAVNLASNTVYLHDDTIYYRDYKGDLVEKDVNEYITSK